MRDEKDRFWRLPDGQMVKMVLHEGDPLKAVVERIDGERQGTRAVCLFSKLEVVESERPKSKET
jgi:hypothetical protein